MYVHKHENIQNYIERSFDSLGYAICVICTISNSICFILFAKVIQIFRWYLYGRIYLSIYLSSNRCKVELTVHNFHEKKHRAV